MALNQHIPDEPLANLLFEFRGADLVLRSHDSHHFRVPRTYIVNSSPVLDELIQRALDPPDAAHDKASLPVLALSESGEILHSLLTFIFPVATTPPSTAEGIMKLLSVASKYQMFSVMDDIRDDVTMKKILYSQRHTILLVYSLAQSYGLRLEASRAAAHLLTYPMDIEDLEYELGMMSGASLYELWQYHKAFRDILASRLYKFKTSVAPRTLTGLYCKEPSGSSPSHIPGWLNVYIESIIENPKLFSLVEFSMALVRHVGDGAGSNGCACASITSQTMQTLWKALESVYSRSSVKVCVVDVTKLSVSQSLSRQWRLYLSCRSERILNTESSRPRHYPNLWTYSMQTSSSDHPILSTSVSTSQSWSWCRLSSEINFHLSDLQMANQSMGSPWFNCQKMQNC